MKKRSLLSMTILTVLLLIGFQIWASHRLSTAGITVTEMTLQAQTLELENEMLRHKIASSSSHLTISQRAKELGFTQAYVRHVEKPPVAMR